jgi:hypothetical protein
VKHIVFFSGGVASWYAARRVACKYGKENTILLFTDTMMEDRDVYRFLKEAAANVGSELITLADGRNPWQIFRDVRFLGNSRIDPCSRILKRELAKKWIKDNFTPEECRLYLGIDWTEEHRYLRAREYWKPYVMKAPLCRPPYILKAQIFARLERERVQPPRTYAMGFGHANCSSFCIKAGQGHYKLLLEQMPNRYRKLEDMEERFRQFIGKDVSIMRRERGGVKQNLTLRQLRLEIEAGQKVDETEVGGCGCFLDDNEETKEVCERDPKKAS